MKIVIIGPTMLTRYCTEALLKNTKNSITVFTLDDRFAYTKSRFALMDDMAEKGQIKLFKVSDINNPETIKKIKNEKPDVIFELGWSQIICKEILDIAKLRCIGVHASLLPKNRGAASLNWAIIKGEKRTGVTLFYLAEKPDDGEIIAQKEFEIDYRDTIETVHSKSDKASADLLLENIEKIENGTVRTRKQDPGEATFTRKRTPSDGLVDWSKSTLDIYNWIRAQTHPFPGAFTFWKGKKIYIWRARETKTGSGKPGEITAIRKKEGVEVRAEKGSILVERAQVENDIEMWADELAEKYGIKNGDNLG